MQVHNNILRQISFFVLILLLATFLFFQLSHLLPSFLGALTFYVLLKDIHLKLVYRYKWNKQLSIIMLLLLSFLIILLPTLLLINMLYSKVDYVVQHSVNVSSVLNSFVSNLEQKYAIELLNDENLTKVSTYFAKQLPSLLDATFSSLLGIAIMYFILYFLLLTSIELELWLIKYIPLKKHNTELLGKELKSLIFSNAIGIPITAILQGIIAWVGYLVLGVNDLFFWFTITCIVAMLPFAGAALAYVPISVLLFAQGHSTKAIILVIYGLAIVGSADNIFRFMLQKRLGNIHPLITVLGVVLGLKLFGFVGMIFGPILIAFFILLIKVYVNEFNSAEEDEEVATINQSDV